MKNRFVLGALLGAVLLAISGSGAGYAAQCETPHCCPVYIEHHCS